MTSVMIHPGFDIEHRSKWRFLRQSRWTKVKVLYIITRYLPFILVAIYLCCTLMHFSIIFPIKTDMLYFSELHQERDPQCAWTHSGLQLILTAWHCQKCSILINSYSCTCTLHASNMSLSSAALSFRRFHPDVTHLLWKYISSYTTYAYCSPDSSRFFCAQNICALEKQ